MRTFYRDSLRAQKFQKLIAFSIRRLFGLKLKLLNIEEAKL